MTFLRDSEQLLLGLGGDDLLLSDGESLLQGVGSGDKICLKCSQLNFGEICRIYSLFNANVFIKLREFSAALDLVS